MKKFSGIVTADWHLDRFNRLDDMSKCVDFVIEEAIRRKVSVFIFNGDGYRTWHPAPIEMNVMHRLTKLVDAGIIVYIVVGNHDWPESGEYKGMHCFMEIKSLNSGIHVIDSVKSAVIDDVHLCFIPHIPKAELQRTGKTYEKYFADAMESLATGGGPSDGLKKRLLFSHAYLREAAVGPSDLMIENDRQITLKTLEDDRFQMVFLGDIHKHQCLRETAPTVLYPGSLDRVDFGEAKDPKGIIHFKFDGDQPHAWQFIRTPARPFVHLEVDLDGLDPGETSRALDDIAKNNTVKDAIVKLTFKCENEEQKKRVDDQAIRDALLAAGASRIRSTNFEVASARIVRAPEISENMTIKEALGKWVKLQKYPKGKGEVVLSSGRKLVEAA